MAIDLATEHVLATHEAAREWPSYQPGKPTHKNRVLRAILTGSPGRDGTMIKLEGARIGRQWVTSREAIQRWSERLSADAAPTPSAPPRTTAARRRAIEKADRELTALGV